jgi:hypothetical protein
VASLLPRPHPGVAALCALALALALAAVAVRGVRPAPVALPEDVVDETPRFPEPMQLLLPGARQRASELDAWVRPELRARFRAARTTLYALAGCPPLLEWLASPDGQHLERLLAELRAGSREEALAALALVVELARATEWDPGLISRDPAPAERLGALLQDWLRVWGERAAADPTLSEPALAAALLYARAMRTAWNAPAFGRHEPAADRARAFLGALTGSAGGRRSAFGEAFQARHGRATASLSVEGDALLAWEREAAVVFPGVEGDCEGR